MKKLDTTIKISATLLLLLFVEMVSAQVEPKKITFIGAARAQFYGDRYRLDEVEDTVTNAKLNSGNTLVDLGINIRPHSNMEIQGLVRIRNDYGGFWGAGVSFDVRQLYVKGVAGGIVRYQLGDINYKLTRYTFWNHDQELISNLPGILQQQTDVVNYDHFYNKDNTWRQQGGSAEMGWVFSKFINELNFYGVTTRVKTSDFSQTNDRIFSGASFQIVQSKKVTLGYTYVNTFDIKGTSRQSATFHQPVMTLNAIVSIPSKKWNHTIEMETGKSKMYYDDLAAAPEFNGQFMDMKWKAIQSESGWFSGLQMKYVSSGFRSIGSQTKRIDYNGQVSAFQRVTNAQVLRPLNMMDLMRESGLYNMQLQSKLMNYNPRYDNITPYGDATPNRQAAIVQIGYEKKGAVLSGKTMYYSGSEVRGEGTTTVRDFKRWETSLTFNVQPIRKDKQKESSLTLRYRNDQTSRPGTESIPSVDLNSKTWTAGLDFEWTKQWHAILGYQFVKYKGFDLLSVKDAYGAIYNFNELNVDGSEQVVGAGVKHVFSDRSFLSAQVYKFQSKQKDYVAGNYNMVQWMLLYQINF